MSGEDLIKQTLARATRGEPAAGDAFVRFRTRERRSTRLRNIVVAAGTLAALATLVLTLPGLGGSGPAGPLGSRGGTESPQPRLYREYHDPVARWGITYPAEWGGRARPGRNAVFFPLNAGEEQESAIFTRGDAGTPSIETPTRFYFQWQVLDTSCRPRAAGTPARCESDANIRQDLEAQAAAGGVTVERSTTVIANRTARTYELTYTSDSPNVPEARPRRWCARCYVVEHFIPWEDGYLLHARIVAPSVKAYEVVADDVERVLKSLLVLKR